MSDAGKFIGGVIYRVDGGMTGASVSNCATSVLARGVASMKFRITAVVAAALISSHGSAVAICTRSEPYCDA